MQAHTHTHTHTPKEMHTDTHNEGFRGFEATCDLSNVFVPEVPLAAPLSTVRNCTSHRDLNIYATFLCKSDYLTK